MAVFVFPSLTVNGFFSPPFSVSPQVSSVVVDTHRALTCLSNAQWPWPHLSPLSLYHVSHLSPLSLC